MQPERRAGGRGWRQQRLVVDFLALPLAFLNS
jgi:hypothetical protein